MIKRILTMLAIAVISVLPSCAYAAEAPDIAHLLDERQTDLWVEGQHMGDIVFGARGSMQFIYVDAKLSKAITESTNLESWVGEMAQYFGTEAVKGKSLFIVHINTYKPWDFDPTKIQVAGRNLEKNDVLSSSMTNPFGQLASKDDGYFAFAVPASLVKPGASVTLGYGDDSQTWKVPK